MCFVWLSEETATFAIHIVNRLVFVTEVETVYCAVRTESLIRLVLEGLNRTYAGSRTVSIILQGDTTCHQRH